MDSFQKQALKQEARRRLRAQRQRAGQLRVRVVTIALIGFVLLWGVIFVQMATGHDPVLAGKSAAVAASPAGRKHRVVASQGAGASEPPAEAPETDAEGGDDPGEAASEAIETTDPEELEAQQATEREALEAAEARELEAAELEAAEAEAIQVEPAPVTTSQS
jgi:cytoskeletal protein RodZ